jgi:hypothetical protein
MAPNSSDFSATGDDQWSGDEARDPIDAAVLEVNRAFYDAF